MSYITTCDGLYYLIFSFIYYSVSLNNLIESEYDFLASGEQSGKFIVMFLQKKKNNNNNKKKKMIFI